MPLYSYKAFDKENKKRKGLIEGLNEVDAKRKLREQEIMLVSLEEKKGAAGKENLKGERLVTFTVQLSHLVAAGVPIYQALMALEEQYRGEAFDRVLLSLCEKIKAGTPLSTAMADFPNTFDRLYCSMISAGESAGAIDVILEKLSGLLSKQDKLKKEIMTAMIYPSILASFSLIVIIMLMGFVIPSIEGIFSQRQLNGFTAFVIGISHFFRNWWWVYFPVLAATIGWLVYTARSPSGKIFFEKFLLKLPLIRTMLIEAAVARFCRTMGTLQKGGLTIIDSLRISGAVMHNVTLEEEIRKAEAKIIEGSALSIELSKSRLIPRMVSKMLAIGEESGSTTTMMNKIADMYEENLEKTLKRFMALIEPAILLIMGSVIGSVLLAILLPLTDTKSLSM